MAFRREKCNGNKPGGRGGEGKAHACPERESSVRASLESRNDLPSLNGINSKLYAYQKQKNKKEVDGACLKIGETQQIFASAPSQTC